MKEVVDRAAPSRPPHEEKLADELAGANAELRAVADDAQHQDSSYWDSFQEVKS